MMTSLSIELVNFKLNYIGVNSFDMYEAYEVDVEESFSYGTALFSSFNVVHRSGCKGEGGLMTYREWKSVPSDIQRVIDTHIKANLAVYLANGVDFAPPVTEPIQVIDAEWLRSFRR